jgi:hypothetical protein
VCTTYLFCYNRLPVIIYMGKSKLNRTIFVFDTFSRGLGHIYIYMSCIDSSNQNLAVDEFDFLFKVVLLFRVH